MIVPLRSAEVWSFPLRTVTPAFVGGASPNDRAELTASSVRGALRAWYRLLVGPEVAAGLSGPPDLRESLLFGGVGPGEGQGLVSLAVRGRGPKEPHSPPTGTTGWSNRELRSRQPGLAYLGFSLDLGGNQRKAVPPGARFELRMSFRRGVPDVLARLLLDTVYLWVALGGVGSRSRRGFGSLWWDGAPTFSTLRGAPVPRDLPGPWQAESMDSWGRALENQVRDAMDHAKRLSGERSPSDARESPHGPAYLLAFDWPGDDRSRVVVWAGDDRQGWASASDALNAFGVRFAEHRRTPGIDGLSMGALATLAQGRTLAFAPRRTAYGLPLALRPVGRGGQRFELLPVLPGREGGGRVPSPLLVSVCPVGPQYCVVLTLLSGPWAGRDVEVRESRDARGFVPTDPTNRLPHEFLDSLRPRKEVQP